MFPDTNYFRKKFTVNIKRRIVEHHGSLRGFVFTVWHRFLGFFGSYYRYRKVNWQSVDRLVFVCKGNVCRSAFAEAVAHSLGVEAISCGLYAGKKLPANKSAMLAAEKLGYSLQTHETMPVESLELRETDLLVSMEPWQTRALARRFSRKYNNTLMGLWGNPILPYITDPYGASPEYFKKCFVYIKSTVNELSKKIEKKSSC